MKGNSKMFLFCGVLFSPWLVSFVSSRFILCEIGSGMLDLIGAPPLEKYIFILSTGKPSLGDGSELSTLTETGGYV